MPKHVLQLITYNGDGTAILRSWPVCVHKHDGLVELAREALGEPAESLALIAANGNSVQIVN